MQHETFPKNSHDTHAPDTAHEAVVPATDAYGRDPDRWTGSGDPDDPTAGLSDREYDIYWAGVRDSIRLEKYPRAGDVPSPLPQAGGAGGGHDGALASTELPTPSPSRLREGDYADPDDALVRPWLDDLESGMRAETYRDSGWNPRRQRVFLEALADSGIVTQACRAAAISPRAAYNLRNRDAIFAEAWVAAQALARQRLADDLLERALRGQADRIVRNGEVIAERHRTDNRLALGLLTRLDRQAEPDAAWQLRNPDHGPTPHKVLMAHWDQYLDTLSPPPSGEGDRSAQPSGGGDCATSDQLTNPTPAHPEPVLSQVEGPVEGRFPSPAHPEPVESHTQLHTQLHTREPAAGRCELHELVRTLAESDTARKIGAEIEKHTIWRMEGGEWRTDYPPPPGFTGWQSGDYGDCKYERALAPEESAIAAQWEEEDAEEESATLAQAEAQRRAAFGLLEADENGADDPGDAPADEPNAICQTGPRAP